MLLARPVSVYYFNVYTNNHNCLTAKGTAHATFESFKRPFVQTYVQPSIAMGRLYLQKDPAREMQDEVKTRQGKGEAE